ncbi:hypothetical protein ACQKGL_02155 [Ensifer adhaerens]|uniref:hypothetical protein n=1 Tax=Ensifer adhaerens TaxID=106592 RepID=UPI003D05837D
MAGFDFTDILKKVLGGGIFAPPTDPTTTGSTSPVPLKGALLVEEEEQNGNYFSRMFHDDPTKQDALNSGLINAGAAMMMAGGPSRDPTNLMSVIGRGIGVGNQAYTDYRKDAVEIGNASAKADALKRGQALSAELGGSIGVDGKVGPMGLSTEELMKVWRYQIETGDEAGARDTLGMIQQLQQTGAKAGMVAGEDGKFELAGGYGESLNETERQKASGRKAGEAPFATTTDITNYNEVKRQNDAAGIETPSIGEWLATQNKQKATTINTGVNSDKFKEEIDKKAAERYNTISAEGAAAPQMIGDMQTLMDIGRTIQTGKGAQWKAAIGPYAEAVGVEVEGLSGIQAYDAIVSRLAPQMRPAGAGATSDFDAKQYLKSIPSIGNTAEGNAIIAQTMEAIAKNKMDAAEIAGRVQRGEITWQDGDAEIRKLPNPYARFKEYQKSKRGNQNASEDFEEMPKEGPLRVLGVDTASTVRTEPKDTPKPSGTVNTTQKDWDSAPSGTIFIWNGKRYKKP